jgi:threonine dehydratase
VIRHPHCSEPAVTVGEVEAAADRIARRVHRTPVTTSATLDAELGISVYFKCENFQKTGSYKVRGALNAVAQLDDEAAGRGVLCHSSGNHGAALAWAAGIRGIDCTVVVPSGALPIKVAAMRSYGARIEVCGIGEREQAAQAALKRTGATFIHPFDDPRVIAGQGTAVLELLEEVENLELLVAPIGGGGLLSATAVVAGAMLPELVVIGAEPAAADDAYRSLATGARQPAVENPQTIADGLLGGIGEIPFAILRGLDASVVTVTEKEIVDAAVFHLERMKLVVEPSAATALAALRKLDHPGRRVGVIITGGNTDLGWMA